MLDYIAQKGPPVSAVECADGGDDIEGYQRLWAAVIMAHFRTAFSTPSTLVPLVEIDRSISWFASMQCDLVCDAAGVCPRAIRRAFAEMSRDPAMARKRLRAVVARAGQRSFR